MTVGMAADSRKSEQVETSKHEKGTLQEAEIPWGLHTTRSGKLIAETRSREAEADCRPHLISVWVPHSRLLYLSLYAN